jgi:hypothetical protein
VKGTRLKDQGTRGKDKGRRQGPESTINPKTHEKVSEKVTN